MQAPADNGPDSEAADEADAEAMRRLAAGDPDALGELYVRHRRLVATVVLGMAPGFARGELEDVIQDVFLALRDTARRYREQGRFRGWLVVIAGRIAHRRLRGDTVHRRALCRYGEELPKPGPAAAAEAGAAPDLRLDVCRLLDELPPIQRRLLLLFEVEGLSGEELAEAFDLPPNTVWSHLRRARTAMRRALAADDEPEVPR
ncbi:MAG: sigma-70 family RNA polymerase sigma factor [Deltaproteobacteria bacterium]|nr:sigma-70 family RNA polymerase sigma factor [Deltaproteobacteria bacterium]